jgi:hypothetical protein
MHPISKQQIGKHASKIMRLLLKTVFSIRSVQGGYEKCNRGNRVTKIVNLYIFVYINKDLLSTMTDK